MPKTLRFLIVLLHVSVLRGAPLAPGDVSRGEGLLSRDPAAAESAFRKAVASSPHSARAHAGLSRALLLQGKSTAEAVSQARRAAELEPKKGEFALLLAGAYAGSGDDRAAEEFERALQIDPRNLRARILFARFLWDGGKPERGNRVMEEALKLSPREASLHAEYGEQLPLQGRFESAVHELELARKLGDDRSELKVQLADSLWNVGRIAEARSTLEEAVTRDPGLGPARVELGRILFWTGSPSDAIPHLEAGVRLNPGSSALRLVLGRAYEATGRVGDAEECYRKAVELDGESSIPRITLGQILAREGKTEEARSEIAAGKALYDRERKLQFERSSRRVELNLAREELDHGHPGEALARFEKMPEDSDVLEGRAAALSRLGRHAEAIRLLERASSLDPENKRTRALLSREYQKAGREK